MKKGVYSMYRVKEKKNYYIVPKEKNQMYRDFEIKYSISNTVGKGISTQVHGCIKGMVHFISAGFGMKG